jgi:hypothetical protein
MPADFSGTFNVDRGCGLEQGQAADVTYSTMALGSVAMPYARIDGQDRGRKSGADPEHT